MAKKTFRGTYHNDDCRFSWKNLENGTTPCYKCNKTGLAGISRQCPQCNGICPVCKNKSPCIFHQGKFHSRSKECTLCKGSGTIDPLCRDTKKSGKTLKPGMKRDRRRMVGNTECSKCNGSGKTAGINLCKKCPCVDKKCKSCNRKCDTCKGTGETKCSTGSDSPKKPTRKPVLTRQPRNITSEVQMGINWDRRRMAETTECSTCSGSRRKPGYSESCHACFGSGMNL